ncbi:hypothetical protein TH9N_11230 [Tetragenococcus halophilus]|nr:hypothetical protein TH8N_11220 [Tetragenococcus halophilus]GEQ47010.1 hypothetical protein TH9N_11230 [Tetragenococcus halophilus]
MDNIPTSLLIIYNEKATITSSNCQLSFRHSSIKRQLIKKAPKLGTFYYKSTFFSNKGLTGLLS